LVFTLNLGNPTEEETNIENQNDIERLNIVLNSSITADEIQKSLKKLKNNKSSSEDTIINEYLKHCFHKLGNSLQKTYLILYSKEM
jgi:lipase chaperone LimK